MNRLIVKWPDGRENYVENIEADQELEIVYSKSKPGESEDNHSHTSFFEDITDQNGIDYKHKENVFDDFSRQILSPYKMSELGPNIATADFNGDGYEDFFIGGSAGNEGQLFKQNRNGTFTALESETLYDDRKYEDMGAAFFDADNDGDLDLYVVSGGNEFRPRSSLYQDRIYLNDGSGILSKAPDWLPKTNISGSKVVPADFDKDGDMDLFLAGRHLPWSYPNPESSVILVNKGDKFENVTKEIAPELAAIGMVNDAVWVDLNQDDMLDIRQIGRIDSTKETLLPVQLHRTKQGANLDRRGDP